MCEYVCVFVLGGCDSILLLPSLPIGPGLLVMHTTFLSAHDGQTCHVTYLQNPEAYVRSIND